MPKVRSIFISDIHLGNRACQAERLLEFLRAYDSEHLYLVGDIIDGWQLRRTWYWDQKHNDVVQKILRKARKGTRVVYVPGNHDEFARDYVDNLFGGIAVKSEAIHEMRDGRRLLVMHGDQFDGVAGPFAQLGVILAEFEHEGVQGIPRGVRVVGAHPAEPRAESR
mgnify:CR=1 FL=1